MGAPKKPNQRHLLLLQGQEVVVAASEEDLAAEVVEVEGLVIEEVASEAVAAVGLEVVVGEADSVVIAMGLEATEVDLEETGVDLAVIEEAEEVGTVVALVEAMGVSAVVSVGAEEMTRAVSGKPQFLPRPA